MNIRLNFANSFLVALLLTVTTACTANAQVPQQVTEAEFFAARVNGHTPLQDFNTHADNRDPLKATMGQPTAEVCETTAISTDCTVNWNGVEVAYTDIAGDLEVATLKLTTPAEFLDYGGTTIRVGDPISRLQQIFPEAYQNRGDNCPAHPASVHPCSHAAIVKDGGISGMHFRYNPSTLVIEEIKWHRNII
ncbi:MAG: hypothetical protein RQ745_13945 [Longimicrobiales bacterium]|nr:hypothetical protein [Longimicrobiales bacterium]